MTPEEHIKHLLETNRQFHRWYNENLPIIVGELAVSHFKDSFQNEGFTDEALDKWQDVKRRTEPKRNQRTRDKLKILTQQGDLGRSIEFTQRPGEVIIISDTSTGVSSSKDYAKPHNEGTTNAGRNHNVTIPKRQFIGKSAILERKIHDFSVEQMQKFM